MNIYTMSEARAKLFSLVEHVQESHEPVILKGKRANAVILSQEDYDAMQETLYLHSIPGLVRSILDASDEPLADAVKWTDDL